MSVLGRLPISVLGRLRISVLGRLRDLQYIFALIYGTPRRNEMRGKKRGINLLSYRKTA